MSNISPIFPIAEPQHFSDDNYGFHPPQVDYFKIMKDSSKKIKKQSHKKKWWKNSLFFFKWKNTMVGDLNSGDFRRRHTFSGGSIYGPMYITESRVGSKSPCRKTYRRSSGRLAGSLTPTKKGHDLEIPYVNLMVLNMDRISRTSVAPIYLVT